MEHFKFLKVISSFYLSIFPLYIYGKEYIVIDIEHIILHGQEMKAARHTPYWTMAVGLGSVSAQRKPHKIQSFSKACLVILFRSVMMTDGYPFSTTSCRISWSCSFIMKVIKHAQCALTKIIHFVFKILWHRLSLPDIQPKNGLGGKLTIFACTAPFRTNILLLTKKVRKEELLWAARAKAPIFFTQANQGWVALALLTLANQDFHRTDQLLTPL